MKEFALKFLQLLEDSVLLQAILTLAIWGAVIYLALAGKSIPELLGTGAGIILGYYFGNKQAQAVHNALKGK
jgi:hypothetical protein